MYNCYFQSPFFDGKQPNWYHSNCFFTKQRPKAVTDIAHFESIRWEDQEKIKAKLGNLLIFSFNDIIYLHVSEYLLICIRALPYCDFFAVGSNSCDPLQ